MSKELTELEKLAVKLSEEDDCSINQLSKIIDKLIEEGKKIAERIKPKPMFPIEEGFIVGWDGWVGEVDKDAYSNKAARGNTAYTREEAKRLDDRNLARVRVLEKIYVANGYKVRGFIKGERNYCHLYNNKIEVVQFRCWRVDQYLPDEFYTSKEAAEILAKDEDFQRDFLMWQGRSEW